MAETNPRSKLRSMKRRYFWTVAALFFAVFLAFYLFLQIIFMIFELTPYTRLIVVAVVILLDMGIVHYLVNHRWNDRWKREAPELIDAIQVPEPAYIMDEKTAKELAAKQAAAAKETKKKGFFQRMIDSLAPVEETEEETASIPAQKEEKKQQEPAPKPKESHTPRHAMTYESPKEIPAAEAAAVSASKQPSSSWQTKLEDMKTQKIEELLSAENDAEKKPKAAEPVSVKQEAKQDEPPSAKRAKKKESKQQAASKKQAARSEQGKKESKPKQQDRKKTKKQKKGKRKAEEGKKPASKPPVKQAPGWSTPFDEMKTEELQSAVEKALEGGYNPNSDERNK